MGRCPEYLNEDDFDKLAGSIGYTLTDTGVSALGEICEQLSLCLIRLAGKQGEPQIDYVDVIDAARRIGIKMKIDEATGTVTSAIFPETTNEQTS